MSVKRYKPTKDNTITNAYKANLTVRGVSGNMGQSDILEAFHIYGQTAASSQENARILLQFDTSQISTDRTAGILPDSGSVSFFLKLYDAEHTQTTPKSFTIVASAVSQSWDEGLGLDMENYTDEDSSNWLYATDTKVAASASITVRANTAANSIKLTGSSGEYKFISIDDSTPAPNYFHIGADTDACATNIVTIINESASADFSANSIDSVVYLTASTAGSDANSNCLTSSAQAVFDVTGSTNATENGLSGTLAGGFNFTKWVAEGGDYITGSNSAPAEYTFTQSFDTGYEDLEIDVSHLVEDWLKGFSGGGIENNGFGIRLTDSVESATDSYYTKMFFARGSQFFFKKPVLEARWDSSKKDNRGSFYLSSSLVPAEDNLMKLYLYNIVKGNLTDIPAIGTGDIYVSVYSGSSAPIGDKLYLPIGGGTVATGHVNTTASWVETGIYSASFTYASSSITKIYDVWHFGAGGAADSTQYHTGSAVTVKTFDSQNYNFDQKYVSKITNLRPYYSNQETVRFRLYTRQKDWSPTNYTVATSNIDTSIVEDVYYKIARIPDNLSVVAYGTGSVNHTRLSYDVSGSYFDFKMNMLDNDTAYEISFVYLINGNYVEQPDKFRFRVE